MTHLYYGNSHLAIPCELLKAVVGKLLRPMYLIELDTGERLYALKHELVYDMKELK